MLQGRFDVELSKTTVNETSEFQKGHSILHW